MALPAYLWITDANGSLIPSTSQVAGRENSIEVIAFNHEIYIPNDRDSGLLTGTRKHQPYTITKNFCSASPLLAKACCNGQNFETIRVSWYRVNSQGQEEEYFRHVLSDAKVVAVKPVMLDIKNNQQEGYGHMEEISFRYERIQWTYVDGNITTEDQWRLRV